MKKIVLAFLILIIVFPAIGKKINHKTKKSLPRKYTDLLPYIIRSPDQNQGEWGGIDSANASTCLQMASTGAMEMLMNMDVPPSKRLNEGDSDLSERWLIAAEKMSGMSSTKRDVVKLFNYYGGGLLNRDYRFTIGKIGDTDSVKYNWYNKLPKDWKKLLVKTPKVSTKRIMGSLDSHMRWEVGIVTEETIEEIKKSLIKYRGPVLVKLNSEEFWHAVLIVGYDEDDSVGECPYVKSAMELLRPDHLLKVKRAIQKQGGCRQKGVFYVRDSEYYDSSLYQHSNDLYNYVLESSGEERPYLVPYIKRSYDWFKFLGNYATVIYRKDVSATKYPPKKIKI